MQQRYRTLVLVGTIALGVGVLATGFRVLSLGGLLGGFEDDQFVTLSQAQQMVMGEWPLRDFPELGMPLATAISAIGQAVIGRTLFAEALVTASILGLCAAVLFVLAWRVSGSVTLALLVSLLQIAMAPRFYNFPKLLAYAIAIPAFWAYIDHPTRRRLVLIAVAGVVAFLLRHDHGLYVGIAAVATVVLAHAADPRRAMREALLLALVAGVLVSPYLVVVQRTGGLVPYLQSFVRYANQTAERTQLSRPHFAIDWSQPIVGRIPPPPRPAPRVNIRWATGIADEVRAIGERDLGLTAGQPRSGGVFNYELTDWSGAQLARIVQDARVADTQGIDRGTFVLNDSQLTRVATTAERLVSRARAIRFLPGLLSEANALPFLYYLLWALPVGALGLLLRLRTQPPSAGGGRAAARVAVVVLLAFLTARGFLRGNLASRLADVTEPVGVLAAWVSCVVIDRSSRWGRIVSRVALAVVFALAVLSVEALESVSAHVGQSGLLGGTAGIARQWRDVRAALSASPPVSTWPPETPGVERLAHYIDACTRADDRLLVLGYTPQLFYLAQRRFAAGSVWIQPNFLNSEADQTLMLERINAHRVPIAVTPPEPVYSEDYVTSFATLTRALDLDYRFVATVDFGRGAIYRVLVRRDLASASSPAFNGLPCFS